ncbi:MAG: chalcone isomerase family protein [Myxococcales bacterium]|nr:chalcone isomerase family protein [Myxococcales bacterium]
MTKVSWRFWLLCVLILFVGACTPTPEPQKTDPNGRITIPEEFTEEGTQVKFKAELKADNSDKMQFLMGMGIRKKLGLINIYAMGLYIEPVGAATALATWKGMDVEKVKADEAYFTALMNGKFAKTMRLAMVFNVSGDDMASAFEESIQPRLKTEEGKAALTKFRGYFTEPVKDGEELIFAWSEDGMKVFTTLNGVAKEAIENADFAQALLAVYLDSQPISEEAKKNFANNVKMMFQKADDAKTANP